MLPRATKELNAQRERMIAGHWSERRDKRRGRIRNTVGEERWRVREREHN